MDLDAHYALDPQVSLRPEPFGALAYHFGNRRLSFLRSPDILAVVRSLDDAPSVAAALETSGIEQRRWPSFIAALTALESSDMIHAIESSEAADVA
jgi:putative mycofactocin binding protein MftB